MGRQMGLQKTGNLDIVYDMQPQHQDPDYGAFMDQVKTFQHFATWHQGALFTKISDSQECPRCHQPATAVHLLWMCSHTNRAFPALHQDDLFELEHGINLEFWAQGLLQLPLEDQATGGPSVQACRTWSTQDEARIQHPDVVTIGVAPTSTDGRLKHFAVAIVHHTQLGGQLYRQGAVIVILPGKQS